MVDSKRPLKVRDKDGELYVYTNRRIKIEEEDNSRSVKKSAKKAPKQKK